MIPIENKSKCPKTANKITKMQRKTLRSAENRFGQVQTLLIGS